jgi:O-antigen/teichoic acid export membrane protein
MLVFLRVSLTLLLEGIMLYLFGFRKKRSWLCFFIVNLVTQGVLNYLLIAISPYNGYAIFSLVFYEFWIIIIETVTFGICLNEQRLLRRVLYAVTANLASLFLGGYLILMLPV